MRSYDSAPLPSGVPSREQVLSLSQSVYRRSSLLTGERGGRGAKSYDDEEDWSSINHSILSDFVAFLSTYNLN